MTDSSRSVVIHGHFYQPPREDPWTEEVERQPSAAPHHDWNERIESECYRAVVAARVPGRGGRIRKVVNTLESISFNFGPTLLAWMEAEAPRTYAAVLEADRASVAAHGGHGNAIAQPYHHTILPLASRRDKVTEVRWGIADFRARFRREPEGIWLPETAVDEETLDVLAQEGLSFTILAPHQVEQAPENGMPGLFRGGNGRSLAVFIYDGSVSHDVAFGPLLKDAKHWARRMAGEKSKASGPGSEARGPRLISVATDGETYGHHHAFGEMALAAVLSTLHARRDVRVENFASFLARHPAKEEIRLDAPSSWSCSHGVQRWQSECGCKMYPERESQQAWRRTLRDSMNFLANRLHAVYEAEGVTLLADPWGARDGYLLHGLQGTGERASDQAGRPGAQDRHTGIQELEVAHQPEVVRELELLEMERNALRLFTSCGWFFDDMAGIETLQVLRYAARAIELAGPGSHRIEEEFLGHLANALTNEDPPRDGRTLFLDEVKPKHPAELRVAAGHAVLSFLGEDPSHRIAGYSSEDAGKSPPEATAAPQVADPDGEASGTPQFTDSEVERWSAGAVTSTSAAGGSHAEDQTQDMTVRVRHQRTCREWLVRTRLEAPSLGRVSISAKLVGGSPALSNSDGGARTLSLSDLPDGLRTPAEAVLRATIVSRCIASSERQDLLTGRRTLAAVAEDALVRALRELSDNPSEGEEQRIVGLANLFELLHDPIPFDAQTEFHRALLGASPLKAASLDRLADPLGCVTTP